MLRTMPPALHATTHDLRSVWAALRVASPVVLDVPADIRYRLLQRYVDMSLRNGRLGVLSFALMLFGVAYEAPLPPRLLALFGLGAILLARMDLSDRALYDAKQSGRDRVEVHAADQGRMLTQQPDSTSPGALM